MHSPSGRANAVFSHATTVLSVLAVMLALSSFFHHPQPSASIRVNSIHKLRTIGMNEEAILSFDVDFDFTSVFDWNVKQLFVYVVAEYETPLNKKNQVVVWDYIIRSKEAARFSHTNMVNKYPLVDQGRYLAGNSVKLRIAYDVTPVVGLFYDSSIQGTPFQFIDRNI